MKRKLLIVFALGLLSLSLAASEQDSITCLKIKFYKDPWAESPFGSLPILFDIRIPDENIDSICIRNVDSIRDFLFCIKQMKDTMFTKSNRKVNWFLRKEKRYVTENEYRLDVRGRCIFEHSDEAKDSIYFSTSYLWDKSTDSMKVISPLFENILNSLIYQEKNYIIFKRKDLEEMKDE